MWNPVTITALVSAVAGAAVAIITAIRTPNRTQAFVAKAFASHLTQSHTPTVTDDFESRVNPN